MEALSATSKPLEAAISLTSGIRTVFSSLLTASRAMVDFPHPGSPSKTTINPANDGSSNEI